MPDCERFRSTMTITDHFATFSINDIIFVRQSDAEMMRFLVRSVCSERDGEQVTRGQGFDSNSWIQHGARPLGKQCLSALIAIGRKIKRF